MATLSITADLLERACNCSGFPIPAGELIFFGVRGAMPDSAASTGFRQSQLLRFTQIDYRSMRCTIGQWHQTERSLAAFPGSTVPSLPNIASAKEKGGVGTNLLMSGRLEYVQGTHKPGKPSGHRAFRQAKFFPVRRTRNNTSYDAFDDIDFGGKTGDFVWDNLHSGYSATQDKYSSAGCQVVCGLPKSASLGNQPETGPWRDFLHNAYDLFGTQKSYSYLLFSAEELAALSTTAPADLRQVVRYGSVGAAATLVQTALVASGDLVDKVDGDFGRKSLMALVAFQSRKFPRNVVDGICGANTANALGIVLPPPAGVATAFAAPRTETASVPETDIADETDMITGEAERLLALLGIGPARPAAPPDVPPLGPVSAAANSAVPESPTFDLDRFIAAASGKPFSRSPSQSQRDGMSQVIEAFYRLYPGGDYRWLAYILATVFHETGTRMVPVREGFATDDAGARAAVKSLFDKGRITRDYAIPDAETGFSYFGRGRVQTTFKKNYATLSARFGRDFVNQPSLMLDPVIDAEIAVVGHVEGLWTRKKLSDYIDGDQCDYRAARKIVNGTDRADDIANYARQFASAIEVSATQDITPVGSSAFVSESAPILTQGDTSVAQDNITETLTQLRLIAEKLGINVGAVSETPAVADSLKQITSDLAALAAGKPGLSPVNAALGQGLGQLLDGKKTVIGIGGALLAAVAGNGGENVTKIAGAVTDVLPILSGAAGPSLPIFVALAVWGLLGKVEKMIIRNRP